MDYLLIKQSTLNIETKYARRNLKGILKFSDDIMPHERMKEFQHFFGGEKNVEEYEINNKKYSVVKTEYSHHTEKFITDTFSNYFANLNSK